MKLVVLNIDHQCIEVYPIDKYTYEKYGGDNFDGAFFISEQELPMNDCDWMLVEDDVVPVYWNGGDEPYTEL